MSNKTVPSTCQERHTQGLMRPLAVLMMCAAVTACAGGAAGSNELVDPASGATCLQGANVRITKNDFSTVLNGQCGAVHITGSNGSVNVDEAQSITVEGQHVNVINEKVGTLNVLGSDNNLNMTQVGQTVVTGDRNTLLGRSYEQVTFKGNSNVVNTDNEPKLDDQGTGNKVI